MALTQCSNGISRSQSDWLPCYYLIDSTPSFHQIDINWTLFIDSNNTKLFYTKHLSSHSVILGKKIRYSKMRRTNSQKWEKFWNDSVVIDIGCLFDIQSTENVIRHFPFNHSSRIEPNSIESIPNNIDSIQYSW